MLDEKSPKSSVAHNAVTEEHSHALLMGEGGPASAKNDPPPGPRPEIEPPKRGPNEGQIEGRTDAKTPYRGLRSVNGPLRGEEDPPPDPPDPPKDVEPETRGPRPR